MNPLKTLSIIIPVCNEEQTIDQVLREVTEQELPGWRKHIIVVNDGSRDMSSRVIETWAKRKDLDWDITALAHAHNRGKGAAVRTGLGAAMGDAVMIQDADLEYHPRDIPALLTELQHSKITAIYGSRSLKSTGVGYWHYVIGARALTILTNLLFGSRLTDVYTGYKMFRLPEIYSYPLKANGFEFEAEITARLLKQKAIIKEVPISYSPRRFGQGKKIRARDGVIGAWTLLKHRIF